MRAWQQVYELRTAVFNITNLINFQEAIPAFNRVKIEIVPMSFFNDFLLFIWFKGTVSLRTSLITWNFFYFYFLLSVFSFKTTCKFITPLLIVTVYLDNHNKHFFVCLFLTRKNHFDSQESRIFTDFLWTKWNRK